MTEFKSPQPIYHDLLIIALEGSIGTLGVLIDDTLDVNNTSIVDVKGLLVTITEVHFDRAGH